MSCAGDESGTVRHLTLSRSDTRVRVDVEERNLFCIRLHFVLEERIGVEKISAERFLTIDEAACRHVFPAEIFVGEILGGEISRPPQTR
jgi:hypothetical protein